MENSQDTIEKLEQEITIHLQKIDSNFSYCFNKITHDIVPNVQEYGSICGQIMDSSSWLLRMFQQTGNIKLGDDQFTAENGSVADTIEGNKAVVPRSSIFPSANNTAEMMNSETGMMMVPKLVDAQLGGDTQEFHTADITSTGRVLTVPDSSDEEQDDDDDDGSTAQRQRRKRKISLLLQQEYASSSAMASPYMAKAQSFTKEPINSSPSKVDDHSASNEDEKEVPKPGTVIHFTTS